MQKDLKHDATDGRNGFPKPAHVTYAVMINGLHGKKYICTMKMAGIVQAHMFVGEDEECIVAWTYPPRNASIKLSELRISPSKVVKILNAAGVPLPPYKEEKHC